jgi:malto-oligosyltrehalose trehalohydrolase
VKGVVEQNSTSHSDAQASLKEFRIFPKRWGSEYIREGEVRFRLWAPEAKSVSLRIEGEEQEMSPAADGWFELLATGIAPEARYQFLLPGGKAVPDPASRAQDGGIEGASIVTDPTSYRWRHADWPGRTWEETVIYELHAGTFTPEGTFRAAAGKLAYLAELGITAVEVMPVGQFPGERGWGYDGVLPYAPHHAYGSPDDFKAFIDAAHGHGIMVFLDVIYNHFGPEGNYLPTYAKSFFHRERKTPWGATIDFTERPVRDFFIENALYWLLEFNLDGLRLDAVHAIEDDESEIHIISELAARVRAECRGRRRHLVVEDNRNTTRFLKREDGFAKEIDASWNDDFHHAAHVIATNETNGYLAEFDKTRFRDLGTALAEGYAHPGDAPVKISRRRTVAAPSLVPPTSYVIFVQNHDQIGNRAFGERLNTLATPEMLDVLETMMLLSPSIPLIFMGEDYGETRPFQFFCDYGNALAKATREGRLQELIGFGALTSGAKLDDLPDPNDVQAFAGSRLDWKLADAPDGKRKLEMVRELLAKRRKHIVPGLRGVGDCAGTLHRFEANVLSIDWQLNGFLLEMRANLTDEPADLHAIRGDIIHTYPANADIEDGKIGPMTVMFAKWA